MLKQSTANNQAFFTTLRKSTSLPQGHLLESEQSRVYRTPRLTAKTPSGEAVHHYSKVNADYNPIKGVSCEEVSLALHHCAIHQKVDCNDRQQ